MLVLPRLQHDRVALGQAPVDDDWVVPASAGWWNRAEVELGVIARQALLGREVDILVAASCDLSQLVEVDSLQAGRTART